MIIWRSVWFFFKNIYFRKKYFPHILTYIRSRWVLKVRKPNCRRIPISKKGVERPDTRSAWNALQPTNIYIYIYTKLANLPIRFVFDRFVFQSKYDTYQNHKVYGVRIFEEYPFTKTNSFIFWCRSLWNFANSKTKKCYFSKLSILLEILGKISCK